MDLEKYVREVKDWPKKGVGFKDITPMLEDPKAFASVVDELADYFIDKKVDKVVGIDARGFLLAAPVAYKLNAGLSIVRKKGKLPRKVVAQKYALEYAENVIEMHKDTIKKGEKVYIVDDVLATGGTMEATCKLVEKLGGEIVGVGFLINLKFLKGEERLKKYPIYSLIDYED